jgi:hypothetical protein
MGGAFGMITVEVSPDSIVVDIDEEARVVTFSEVPPDLAQIGIAAGAVCASINEEYAYHFFAKGGALSLGKPLKSLFFVGSKSISLVLIFRDAVVPSVAPIERAASESTAAPTSDASEDGAIPHNTEFVVSHPAEEPVNAPWRDPRPVFANLPELPIADRQHERVRPPRPLRYEWPGWGREPDDWR